MATSRLIEPSFPPQDEGLLGVTLETTGNGFTVTVTGLLATEVQPAKEQVAVYVVVTEGVTVMVPAVAPVLQVMIPPLHPVAVRSTDCPSHTAGAAEVITGAEGAPGSERLTVPGAEGHPSKVTVIPV